ncbi:putative outer membrane protein assembly factor [Spirochaetota bacterium]|nr:putative outer membrane protein assembly factor [Spirochaetota bacterium]
MGWHLSAIDILAQEGDFPAEASEITEPLNESRLFEEEDRLIGNVIIRGLKTVRKKKVRSVLSLKTGEVADPATIRASFKRLYDSGLFADIEFFSQVGEATATIDIIVQVEEYPLIGEINFIGSRQFRIPSLRSAIDIARRQRYRENEVITARVDLLQKYRDAGFNNVKITYTVTKDPIKNQIIITFFIKEGVRMLVKRIDFEGNKAVKSYKLRRAMETKRTGAARKAQFDSKRFEADKEKVIYALQTKGYVDSKIVASNFSHQWKNPKKKNINHIFIKMDIEQGDLYYFGTVDIRGNTIFSKREITRRFSRKEGKYFDQSKHDKDIALIYQKYQEQGYIFARVTPIATTNADRTIDYVFDIYEGRKSHIERIFIEGLVKTKEYVVEREFSIEEGEIFNVSEFKASLTRLNRLGYFSEIKPNYNPGSAEGLMNVVVNLKEQQTGLISGGISYSTLYGLSLIFNLEEKNLLGRGQTISMGLTYGVLAKEIKFSFVEPWIGGKPVSLGGSISYGKYYRPYYINQVVTNEDGSQRRVIYPGDGGVDLVQNTRDAIRYTEDLLVLSIFSGQNLGNWFRLTEGFSFNYSREYLQNFRIFPETYKQNEVYDLNKDLFDPPPPNELNIYYILSVVLSRDKRNSTLNPTEGVYASLGSFFYFGSYRLIKWHFDLQAVFSPIFVKETVVAGMPWHIVFSYKGRFRTLGDSFQGDFVYPERLYYKFLNTQLRGWSYDNIYNFRVARFGTNSLHGDFPYGKALIEHEFEMRIGIPVDTVQAVLFWEFGNLNREFLGVGQDGSAFLFDFENFMYSLGFGARVNLPVFPIRLYAAWRYIYDSELNNFRLYQHTNSIPEFVFDFQVSF